MPASLVPSLVRRLPVLLLAVAATAAPLALAQKPERDYVWKQASWDDETPLAPTEHAHGGNRKAKESVPLLPATSADIHLPAPDSFTLGPGSFVDGKRSTGKQSCTGAACQSLGTAAR